MNAKEKFFVDISTLNGDLSWSVVLSIKEFGLE